MYQISKGVLWIQQKIIDGWLWYCCWYNNYDETNDGRWSTNKIIIAKCIIIIVQEDFINWDYTSVVANYCDSSGVIGVQ